MLRYFVILIVLMVIIGFALANAHRVTIGLLVGPPVSVPMIFVILVFFLGGFFAGVILNLYLQGRRSNKKEKPPESLEEETHF